MADFQIRVSLLGVLRQIGHCKKPLTGNYYQNIVRMFLYAWIYKVWLNVITEIWKVGCRLSPFRLLYVLVKITRCSCLHMTFIMKGSTVSVPSSYRRYTRYCFHSQRVLGNQAYYRPFKNLPTFFSILPLETGLRLFKM